MRSFLFMALLLSGSTAAFGADGADGALVCDNLRTHAYVDASNECLRLISWTTFDQGAVNVCNELVNGDHPGTAMVCLRESKEKRYTAQEIANCMISVKSDDPASALTCMNNSGEELSDPN